MKALEQPPAKSQSSRQSQSAGLIMIDPCLMVWTLGWFRLKWGDIDHLLRWFDFPVHSVISHLRDF